MTDQDLTGQASSLRTAWASAQVRHVLDCAEPFALHPGSKFADLLHQLPRDQLIAVADTLAERLARIGQRMVGKKEVARRVGMTVSWLNNSDSEMAQALRDLGVRYGRSHNAPVRFPLKDVMQLCLHSPYGRKPDQSSEL